MSKTGKGGTAILCAALIFVFYFFLLEDVAIDYWDTYIAVPATFVAGKPCVITNEAGQPSFEYQLQHRLPQDLIGKGSYGIVSKDQRIGAGVTFSVAYLAFGVTGFRFLYAAFGALTFLLGYLLARKLFREEWQALAFGFIVSINPFMIMMNRLNANFIAVPILLGLAALLFDEKPKWLIAGLVYGALGGIRNEAIMLVPALSVLMLGSREGRRGIFLFGAGAAVGIAPYLAWNQYAFGKALIHASQFSEFEGWRPMFRHEILGWEFEFNGLFNWPFHDFLTRTPHYPFPTYFTLPLVLTLCFGVLLMAAALIGLFAQWKQSRLHFGFWLLWLFFCIGLFLPQENWEEPKTTFGALAIPPLAIFMVRGIGWLLEQRKNWKRWVSFAVLVIVLEMGIYGVRGLQVPLDERWYVRFPKARTEAVHIGCLQDEQRREWMLFHTDECENELAEQRAKLTRGNLLPLFYYPLRLRVPPMGKEWQNRQPEIFDIWDKIYGY